MDERELKGKEAELIKELEEFNREKSRVRNVIGSIGGNSIEFRINDLVKKVKNIEDAVNDRD